MSPGLYVLSTDSEVWLLVIRNLGESWPGGLRVLGMSNMTPGTYDEVRTIDVWRKYWKRVEL